MKAAKVALLYPIMVIVISAFILFTASRLTGLILTDSEASLTYENKIDAKEKHIAIDKRLDRMEKKLDDIMCYLMTKKSCIYQNK